MKNMDSPSRHEPLSLKVGGSTRSKLKASLISAGVRLNAFAEVLLNDPVFDSVVANTATTIEVVVCAVGDLGLTDGVSLSRIMAAAHDQGLGVCPAFAGPYLRLATMNQPSAPDSIMSNGRAPSGSVTVAARPLRSDDEYPKGFYLRAIEGQPWLRGFRCTEDARWHADDRLAFRI